MDLSNLRPADGSKQSDSEEAVDMVQETVRQPVKAIRDRKHVPALQDPDSKAVRCLCTEEYRREDSLAETLRRS